MVCILGYVAAGLTVYIVEEVSGRIAKATKEVLEETPIAAFYYQHSRLCRWAIAVGVPIMIAVVWPIVVGKWIYRITK